MTLDLVIAGVTYIYTVRSCDSWSYMLVAGMTLDLVIAGVTYIYTVNV